MKHSAELFIQGQCSFKISQAQIFVYDSFQTKCNRTLEKCLSQWIGFDIVIKLDLQRTALPSVISRKGEKN